MPIEFSAEDGVAKIVFNRIERLNTFDSAHYVALSKAFVIVRSDPAIRVAIITGAGDQSFSVGAEPDTPIEELNDFAEPLFLNASQSRLPNREIHKPIVAAINGECLNGGLGLLLAADIRIAAEHATFGMPAVKNGRMPDHGGAQRLIDQLPHSIAMDMLLTGETINTPAAEKWGLINRTVPRADLSATTLHHARKIAMGAPAMLAAVAKGFSLQNQSVPLSKPRAVHSTSRTRSRKEA